MPIEFLLALRAIRNIGFHAAETLVDSSKKKLDGHAADAIFRLIRFHEPGRCRRESKRVFDIGNHANEKPAGFINRNWNRVILNQFFETLDRTCNMPVVDDFYIRYGIGQRQFNTEFRSSAFTGLKFNCRSRTVAIGGEHAGPQRTTHGSDRAATLWQ